MMCVQQVPGVWEKARKAGSYRDEGQGGGAFSLEDTPHLTAGFFTDADLRIFLYNVRERVSYRPVAGVIV